MNESQMKAEQTILDYLVTPHTPTERDHQTRTLPTEEEVEQAAKVYKEVQTERAHAV